MNIKKAGKGEAGRFLSVWSVCLLQCKVTFAFQAQHKQSDDDTVMIACIIVSGVF